MDLAGVLRWVEALSGVSAVVAAIIVYRQIERQIRQASAQHVAQLEEAERQHRETLRGNHRPVMTIRAARIVYGRYGAANLVEVTARNVGPGPAMNCELRAWLRDAGFGAGRETFDRLKSEVSLDAPEFSARTDAFAAGEERTIELSPDERAESAQAARLARPYLVYFACFDNVFEERYPMKPRVEWRAGGLLFPLNWAIHDESGGQTGDAGR